MFKRVSEEELLQRRVKEGHGGSLSKLRILEGVPLRKINDSLSSHSSVAASSLHSSLHNTSLSAFSLRASLLSIRNDPSPSPLRRKEPTREEAAQGLLQRYF
jgi:hypothetical protein